MRLRILLALMAAGCTGANAQAGYLDESALGVMQTVGDPPAKGSLAEQFDFAMTRFAQTVPEERYRQARLDEEDLLPRFRDALGQAVDSRRDPVLIALVARSQTDVTRAVAVVKHQNARARPFQRLPLARVCSPDVKADHVEGDSYPSGHSARGWLLALVLSDAAPDRRAALLDRAADYGLSRVICGMHFQSDVEAGRALALEVVGKLEESAAFRTDVACAAQELQRRPGAGPSVLPCEAAQDEDRQRGVRS